MIITIDGQIATGKSTVARKLAEELGYIFFDTGAMYRGITWLAIDKKIDLDDPAQMESLLQEFVFDIKVKRGERHYCVNKQDVTLPIRGDQVTSQVSKVAANPSVRNKLVSMQREFSNGVNAVFEGRDLGTVVFPKADLKIFLTANIQVRAERRFNELKSKFPEESANLTIAKAIEDINIRDNYDTTRVNSPLIKADDAIVVDTSNKTIDEIVLEILEIKDAMGSKRKH